MDKTLNQLIICSFIVTGIMTALLFFGRWVFVNRSEIFKRFQRMIHKKGKETHGLALKLLQDFFWQQMHTKSLRIEVFVSSASLKSGVLKGSVSNVCVRVPFISAGSFFDDFYEFIRSLQQRYREAFPGEMIPMVSERGFPIGILPFRIWMDCNERAIVIEHMEMVSVFKEMFDREEWEIVEMFRLIQERFEECKDT